MIDIVTGIASGLIGFWAFFNRNPKRHPPKGKTIVVSPADGKMRKPFKVKSMKSLFKLNTDSSRKMDKQGELIAIPINLSILNVHITRSPCDAKIIDVIFQKGKFIPANFESSILKNQRNVIIMKYKKFYFAVMQSTGILAKRVRCSIPPGKNVKTGQVIGKILLGSNTTIIVPKKALDVFVTKNMKVRAGESVLGVWN